MKKSYLLAATICMGAAIAFTSCKKEDNETLVTDIDEYVILTPGSSTGFDVEYKPAAYVDFVVNRIDGANISEIKVYKQYVSAEGDTSATKLHSTLTTFPSTVNVTLTKALEGLGVNIADFNTGDKIVFSIRIKSGAKLFNSCHTLVATTVCPTDLAGTYKVVTTYTQHDFMPNFPSFTDTVAITQVEPGKYSLVDLSGGLFSQGPYVGAYGTAGIAVTFQDECNVISWTGVSDPWGQVIPVGVNAVDGATGVITISWQCLAYNEKGVSVYTPL